MLALIPARNEEATVRDVIRNLLAQNIGWVRVVDNGSVDDTPQEARRAGAEVLNEPKRGYGRACWHGLQALPADCEWLLFCDADGSDDLGELPHFFKAALESDFVLGNRRCRSRRDANLGRLQHFGNGLATGLIRWVWG